MFKLFKKVQWISVSAKNIRVGDVVTDAFQGKVVYVHSRTFDNNTSVTIVIDMATKMFGSTIASITVPAEKQIKVTR